MKRLLILASLLALASVAHAANMPERFNGLWVAADVPARDKCQKEEPKGREDDRPVDSMMSIGPEGVTYYELYCKIVSSKILPGHNPKGDERNNLEVNLACKGEGMLWSAREIWHVSVIDSRRVLVVTALSQTNHREEKGKAQKLPSLITTSIYYACLK
jgi:hypothetical protein